MRMGADLRGQMLGGLSSDISDILKKPSRGRGSSSTIFKELKKSGINLSEEQVDEAIYTGKKLGRVKDGQIYEKYSKEEQLKNIEDQIIAKMGSASRPEAIKGRTRSITQRYENSNCSAKRRLNCRREEL